MKYEIEIEGLPEGWQAVSYRYPKNGLELCFLEGQIKLANSVNCAYEQLIVEKIQPRRIALEATDEDADQCLMQSISTKLGNTILIVDNKLWREVKETDIPLTNDEPKLSLSVDECKEIFHCKTANTMNKIREFIKDK